MKKLLLLLAVVVAFSFTALAQEQQTTTQSTTQTTTKAKKSKKGEAGEAKKAKESTVEGCLAAGTEPNTWMLTKGKKSYEVTGIDLSQHVGHEVKVTGNMEKKAEAGEKKAEKHLVATNVEHVADTCTTSSASKAPKAKKEKKGEKGEAATPPGF